MNLGPCKDPLQLSLCGGPDNVGAGEVKLTLIYERRREAGGVVVLIEGVVPVAIDKTVVRAGADPVPCGPGVA